MESFENIKEIELKMLKEDFELWKNSDTSLKEYNMEKIENCIKNIDDWTKQMIATHAMAAINATNSNFDNLIKFNTLDIRPEDPEYAFLKENRSRFFNPLVKDQFLNMISKRYGFEIPSVQETEMLERKVNIMQKELWNDKSHSSEHYQKMIEMDMLNAKLNLNRCFLNNNRSNYNLKEDILQRNKATLEEDKMFLEHAMEQEQTIPKM